VTAPAQAQATATATDAALARLSNAADRAYQSWQGARVWRKWKRGGRLWRRKRRIGGRFIMTERRQKRELLRI